MNALTQRLHASGWATHVTAHNLLVDWHRLAQEVSDYLGTVDDYTNDLTVRDALELVLTWATPSLRARLAPEVEVSDEAFRAGTAEDGGVAIGRYFRVDSTSGWWWKRRPTTGALGRYLDGA